MNFASVIVLVLVVAAVVAALIYLRRHGILCSKACEGCALKDSCGRATGGAGTPPERPVHPRTGAGGRVRRRQVPRSGTQETVEGAGASNASEVLSGGVPVHRGKVLLHSCCAPCSGAIIEWMLNNGIRPTVFFSNSNITPKEEYELRKAEIVRYCKSKAVKIVDDDYSHKQWLKGSEDFEGCGSPELRDAPERGARCLQCFKFRLLRAAEYASKHGYDTLTTTLASSRWKDLQQVEEAGLWACSQVKGVTFWAKNWRKGGLQERRGQIIKEENFYNQTFCGCEFSRTERPSS